jgi:hypothetical protein
MAVRIAKQREPGVLADEYVELISSAIDAVVSTHA